MRDVAGVAARAVILVGVGPAASLTYDHVGTICRKGTEAALNLDFQVRTISTTIHAVGFGLARNEVLKAEPFGFKRALEDAGPKSESVQEIVFATGRSHLLLYDTDSQKPGPSRTALSDWRRTAASWKSVWRLAPSGSFAQRVQQGRYVFVAMLFKREFENVFDFGMRLPIEECLRPASGPTRLGRRSVDRSVRRSSGGYDKACSSLLTSPTAIRMCSMNWDTPMEGHSDHHCVPSRMNVRNCRSIFATSIRSIEVPELLRDLNRDLATRIRRALA